VWNFDGNVSTGWHKREGSSTWFGAEQFLSTTASNWPYCRIALNYALSQIYGIPVLSARLFDMEDHA
jgi:hypothetical protein